MAQHHGNVERTGADDESSNLQHFGLLNPDGGPNDLYSFDTNTANQPASNDEQHNRQVMPTDLNHPHSRGTNDVLQSFGPTVVNQHHRNVERSIGYDQSRTLHNFGVLNTDNGPNDLYSFDTSTANQHASNDEQHNRQVMPTDLNHPHSRGTYVSQLFGHFVTKPGYSNVECTGGYDKPSNPHHLSFLNTDGGPNNLYSFDSSTANQHSSNTEQHNRQVMSTDPSHVHNRNNAISNRTGVALVFDVERRCQTCVDNEAAPEVVKILRESPCIMELSSGLYYHMDCAMRDKIFTTIDWGHLTDRQIKNIQKKYF